VLPNDSGFTRVYLIAGMRWRKAGSERRSFLSAIASIWRILSRVMPNTLPVSSTAIGPAHYRAAALLFAPAADQGVGNADLSRIAGDSKHARKGKGREAS